MAAMPGSWRFRWSIAGKPSNAPAPISALPRQLHPSGWSCEILNTKAQRRSIPRSPLPSTAWARTGTANATSWYNSSSAPGSSPQNGSKESSHSCWNFSFPCWDSTNKFEKTFLTRRVLCRAVYEVVMNCFHLSNVSGVVVRCLMHLFRFSKRPNDSLSFTSGHLVI